jgi:threonine/homoserine/homoserine lactone efflux protein
VPSHFLVFVGIVVAIALLPGPDTAVVTKNALIHGREAALGSAVGVNVGLSIWTLATAAGVAAVLRSSAVVYDTLRLVGALYLI